MRKYYERYIDQMLEGKERFIMEEDLNFPQGYGVFERTYAEYASFVNYYNDSNRNEITYLSNDRKIIDKTLETIKQLIENQEYVLAQYHIVSLQLYFDIEVKLKTVLATMIVNDMNINSFLNIKNKIDTNEYENYEGLKKDTITDTNTKGKKK